MLSTRFTELVGCAAPVQLAGMPGVGTVELVAAVAEAGGLGMLGAVLTPPDVLGHTLAAINARTSGAVGVNFLMPFLDPECVQVAAGQVRVLEFFYGDPDPELVETVHRGGSLAAWQVGSAEEAMAAERAGCDFLVAQGVEAGGHIRGRMGLLPLLDEVLDQVRIPVVAAGGISSRRSAAAVLAAGAAGVRIGTRFVAAVESGAHPRYQEALVRASGTDTVVTDRFSEIWPNAPHRVLVSCIAAAETFTGECTGETVLGGARMPVPRFGAPCPTRETTGTVEAMALYAGQGVGQVRQIEPAAAILRDLTEGAERLLLQSVEALRETGLTATDTSIAEDAS